MDVTGKVEILKIEPGANAKVTFDKAQATGGVLFDNEQVRLLVDKDIRDCMKEQWPKVLLQLDGKSELEKNTAVPQKDSSLTSINNALRTKTGFALGETFDSKGETMESFHLSNDVLTGDYNSIWYESVDNKATKITVYVNMQSRIQGLDIQNMNPSDTNRRVIRSMYLSLIKSWGDNGPVNLVRKITTRQTNFGPVRTEWDQDPVRTMGNVRYLYSFRHNLDEDHPDREDIFVALSN
jgi:hypothetical protein